jgi:signal transduction histidine kinase
MAAPIEIPGIELLEELGHGTYSVVYRARRGDAYYAVKIPLRNETGIKRQILGRRFRREAVALARLRHPLLPRVMEVGTVDRSPYIIMELAKGETLANRLLHSRLSEAETVELGCQLAKALVQVHQSGLVHRDIKPRNIVFDSRTRQIRLVDFGFAASIDAAFRILEPVGTLEYAAPEQVSDIRQRVDGRADLYAVGCVLYECLTGSPPFTELDPKRLLHQHSKYQLPDIREVVPSVSASVALILQHLLARNPDDRYPSAAALLFDLEHIDEMGSGQKVRPSSAQAASAPVPLLGRSEQLGRLHLAWSEAEASIERTVVIRGPAGSGKTRLARALTDHVVDSGRRVLSAGCHAWDPRPFSAIREILEGYAQVDRALSPEARSALTAHVLRLAGDLAPLLKVISPELASLFPDAAAVPQSHDAQHIFVEGLAEFLSKLFRRVGPAVLFVDDLQWLDNSSRRVLRRAIDRASGSSMLYLFATRSEPGLVPEEDRFLAGLQPERLTVGKLEESDAFHLIGAYLGESSLDADLVRSVMRLSDGTPLSTLEIIRMMLDDGLLMPSWGRWRFDVEAVSKMNLPQSALGVLERRIASFDEMTRATLSAAAVVGMSFPDKLLPLVCDLEEGHTTAALAEARRAMLIEPNRLGIHQFVHDSVREVLLKTIEPKAKQELHQRIAEAMDTLGLGGDQVSSWSLPAAAGPREARGMGRDEPDDVSLDARYALASHFALGVPGRTPQRAYEANVAAARLAYSSFDNDRAVAFFRAAEQSAKLLPPRPDPELDLLVGEAQLRIGSLDQSLEQFGRVLAASPDPLQQALALSRRAWIYQLQLDSRRAWDALGQAFAKLGKPPPTDSFWRAIGSLIFWSIWRVFSHRTVDDPLERRKLEAVSSLYYQAARLASLDEKPIRIVKSAFTGVVPAERLGPSTALARMYATLSFVFTALGRRKTGRKYLLLSEGIARSTGDPVSIALALQIHTATAAWEGNLQDSLEAGKRCLDEYGHWRELSEYCVVAYNQQTLLTIAGRCAEAWLWMERVVDKVKHHEGAAFLIELAELGAHATLTSLGREHEAESLLGKLRALTLRVSPNSGFYTMTYGPRVRLFTECGKLGPEFEALVLEFQSKRFNPKRVHLTVAEYYIHVAHARVHAVLRAEPAERPTRIAQLAPAVRDLTAATRITIIRAHALVIEGYFATFEGGAKNARKAERLFAAAELLGQKESAPWVLYAVHRGRAHLLRAGGLEDAARDQAKMAETLANEHGMTYRVQWIREEFGLRRRRRPDPSSTLTTALDPSQARIDSSSGQLRALVRISQATRQELEPEHQARVILDELVYSVRGERAFLFLAASDGAVQENPLRFYVGRTAGAQDTAGIDPHVKAMADAATSPVGSDERSSQPALPYLIRSTAQRAALAVRLVLRDTTVGAVCLDRELSRGAFTDADGELLATLAGQIPVALELARALGFRHRADEELQRAQTLHAMGRLADGVARDFSQMVSQIRSSTDALMSGVPVGLAESIKAIEAAAARADDLVRELVAFSKSESSDTEPLNINDRLRHSSSLFRELLGDSTGLAVRTDPDLKWVKVDPSIVDQMLVTLIVRARDSMPQGGSVVIETANVAVNEKDAARHPLAAAGDYVMLSVSDTGKAIDHAAQRQLFEPFPSAGGIDSESGLALATLYRNVSTCGGFIDVKSVPVEGTTFRIFLPKTSERVGAKLSLGDAPMLPNGTETLLLVEHEPIVSDAIGRALKGLGYRVLRASDGIEALKIVARRYLEIDMVITDLILPGMNGLELGRELVKMRKAIKILYLSTANGALATRGIASEKVEFLQKPVRQEVLARRVRGMLDGRVAS